MRMRKRPQRGENYFLEEDGVVVTILTERKNDSVECITADGKLSVVKKSKLNLPIIDTAYYEKLTNDLA